VLGSFLLCLPQCCYGHLLLACSQLPLLHPRAVARFQCAHPCAVSQAQPATMHPQPGTQDTAPTRCFCRCRSLVHPSTSSRSRSSGWATCKAWCCGCWARACAPAGPSSRWAQHGRHTQEAHGIEGTQHRRHTAHGFHHPVMHWQHTAAITVPQQQQARLAVPCHES
jgi:hypothetical protein